MLMQEEEHAGRALALQGASSTKLHPAASAAILTGVTAHSAVIDRKTQEMAELQDESVELRRASVLSISSLSGDPVATDACRDVDRELKAIEARLDLFRDRRRRPEEIDVKKDDASAPESPVSSVSSSPTFSKLTKARRQAGQVADEVATTLSKCDQLLQRVKSCGAGASRVSSVSSGERARHRTRKLASSRHSDARSESALSSASSPAREVAQLAIDADEAQLAQRAAAVKRFAAQCQRDIQASTAAIGAHHKQTQASYLKELQRKFDSKKHLTLMTLREKYEKETKALVRAKVEEYELEEAVAVKRARASLLEERNRALQELQSTHDTSIQEQLSRLELELTTEMEREKMELSTQLQEEFRIHLEKMQEGHRESLARWEIEQRQELEQQLLTHREAMVASLLKTQEERSAAMRLEIQAAHQEKEDAELQKLKKALAFGAQAQLQQLRNQLETEHSDKMNDMKTEAALSLEKSTQELREMLTRSHQEQRDQLQRDMETRNRVAVMDLHDSLQTTHQEHLQAVKSTAEQRKSDAVNAYRKDFKLECTRELQALEETLEHETRAKLRQLEMEHADEYERKLEELRARVVTKHARELEAKTSRMIQCKNVLLAEAAAFLSFDNNLVSGDEANPEENSAASHLKELKKHLSKELAQYVDVMVAEFDELAEEQRILVAKITESTQLYLSFKRQCGAVESQNAELTSGLETLHDRLQQKDLICKQLYQANEALLKRLQTPALQASVACESETSSPRYGKSPALARALESAASFHKGAA